MTEEYAQQPWKGLYLTTQGLATIFVRLPAWLAWYSLSFNRPKPTWPMNRAIVRKAYKLYLAIGHKCARFTLMRSRSIDALCQGWEPQNWRT